MGKNRGWDWLWEDGSRGTSGGDVLHLLGKVGDKVISSEGGRRRRGEGGKRTRKIFYLGWRRRS